VNPEISARQQPKRDIGWASVWRAKLEIPPRFLSAPIKTFTVSARLRALIGAVFSLKTINWRLFYGFGTFTGTSRDALTRILSEPYGARSLSTTVHYVPCIKIEDKKLMKKTLNVFRLLFGGPPRP
jgi:hypothetical protein